MARESGAAQAREEQAQAAQEMFKIVSGFWLSRAVQVAATLGIPDLVNGDAVPVQELADQTSTDSAALYRLMRALACFGIFREEEGRRFTRTPLSDVLRSDVPGSMRSAAISELGRVHYASWGHLEESVRTGGVAFDRLYGMDAWEYFDRHPEIGATFNDSMTRLTEVVLRGVLAVYDFSAYRTVVDVGGGRGRLLAAILAANPEARGTLLDRPPVIEEARRFLAGNPVQDRISFAAGDFFEAVPPGADLYTLKWIIHDWAAPKALRILRNVRAAMPPEGRVLLVETVLPEPNTPHFGVLMDLNMLVMTGGRERRAAEYRELLAGAGLRMVEIYPTESPVSIVEAVAA